MKYIYTLALLLALPATSFAAFDRNLTYGATGPDVTELQEMLVESGCLNVTPTGYFGLLTTQAVKCWQALHEVPSTGYFGTLSRSAVNVIIADMPKPKEATTTMPKGDENVSNNLKGDKVVEEIHFAPEDVNQFNEGKKVIILSNGASFGVDKNMTAERFEEQLKAEEATQKRLEQEWQSNPFLNRFK